MNELATKTEKETITSLELLEKINELREKEYNYKIENGLELGKVEKRNGKYTRLEHNGFLKIIRDEFSEEISLGKISQSKYINSRGKEYDNFILTFNQSRQLLTRESKFVRKAVID